MFKRCCICLILILSLTFSFNEEVYADKIPELSCRYYNKSGNWLISQKSDGTGSVFKSNNGGEEVTVGDGTWRNVRDLSKLKWGDQFGKTNDDGVLVGVGNGVKLSDSKPKYLKKCPSHFADGGEGWGYFIFSSDSTSGYKTASSNAYKFKVAELKKSLSSKKYVDPTIKSNFNKEDGTYLHKECPSTAKWINNDSYYARCLYQKKLASGCHIIQVNVSDSGALNVFHDYPATALQKLYYHAYPSSKTIKLDVLKEKFDGQCPKTINVTTSNNAATKGDSKEATSYSIKVDFLSQDGNGVVYDNVGYEGLNLNDSSQEIGTYEYKGFTFGFIDETGKKVTCEDIIGDSEELVDMLHMLVTLVKILVPVLLIVFGSLDFIKAIFSGDESNMKKAQGKFIKRVLISVGFFLAPSLLKFILEIASNIWPVIDAELCGIL